MLLIDDVIKNLQKFKAEHGNIQMCKVGHFGEINEMDDWSFSISKAHYEEDRNKEVVVVDICTPDIGPEPD